MLADIMQAIPDSWAEFDRAVAERCYSGSRPSYNFTPSRHEIGRQTTGEDLRFSPGEYVLTGDGRQYAVRSYWSGLVEMTLLDVPIATPANPVAESAIGSPEPIRPAEAATVMPETPRPPRPRRPSRPPVERNRTGAPKVVEVPIYAPESKRNTRSRFRPTDCSWTKRRGFLPIGRVTYRMGAANLLKRLPPDPPALIVGMPNGTRQFLNAAEALVGSYRGAWDGIEFAFDGELTGEQRYAIGDKIYRGAWRQTYERVQRATYENRRRVC